MTKEARVKLLQQELQSVKQRTDSGAGHIRPGAPAVAAARESGYLLPTHVPAGMPEPPVMPPLRPSSAFDGQTPGRSSRMSPSSPTTSSLARASSLKKRPSEQSVDLMPQSSQSSFVQRVDSTRQVNLVADVILSNDQAGSSRAMAQAHPALHSSARSLKADSVRSSPRTIDVDEDSSQPAVLEGFQAEALQPQLRYGDSISLLPDGINAVVAYAGADDGRAWVEMLDREIGVPPNLRDCQWRVQPARHYVEAKKLEKLMKTSDWDGGRKLPIPDAPYHGQNLEDYAGKSSKE